MAGVPDPGRPPADPDEHALVDRLAEAATAAYARDVAAAGALPPGTIAVVLSIYWDGDHPSQWTPPVEALTPTDAGDPWNDPHAWTDLGLPATTAVLEDGAALTALILERDAYNLIRHFFFTALPSRLRSLWNVPILCSDPDAGAGGSAPLPTQAREQLDGAAVAEWTARGWLPAAR